MPLIEIEMRHHGKRTFSSGRTRDIDRVSTELRHGCRSRRWNRTAAVSGGLFGAELTVPAYVWENEAALDEEEDEEDDEEDDDEDEIS